MKEFRILCLFPALLLMSNLVSNAQIGGISGSKINSYCTGIVAKKQLEIEPSFSWSRSRYQWNTAWERGRIFSSGDSLLVSSGLRLRCTYGVMDKLETGVVYPVDGSMAGWGFRYVIRESQKTGIAVMGGLNTPFGNGIRVSSEHTILNTMQAGAGLILSQSFGPRLSLDINAQAGSFLQKLTGPSGYYQLGADAGYYVLDNQLQLITGLSWQSTFSGEPVQSVLTVYPGVTIETAKNFIIVIHNSLDILGRNVPRQSVLDVSFTLTLE